jgi:hypothetical protein
MCALEDDCRWSTADLLTFGSFQATARMDVSGVNLVLEVSPNRGRKLWAGPLAVGLRLLGASKGEGSLIRWL